MASFRTTVALVVVVAAVAGSSRVALGDEVHEGFQFRGAIGGGYVSDSESPDNAKVSGGGFGFELYAGGYVVPGVAIGGMLGGVSAPGPSVSENGQTVNAASGSSLTSAWIGPYVDIYPDPVGGFHVSLALELARLSVSDGSGTTEDSSPGWGVGAGLGYDWRISGAFSMGLLARLNYSSASLSSGNYTEHTVVPAPNRTTFRCTCTPKSVPKTDGFGTGLLLAGAHYESLLPFPLISGRTTS